MKNKKITVAIMEYSLIKIYPDNTTDEIDYFYTYEDAEKVLKAYKSIEPFEYDLKIIERTTKYNIRHLTTMEEINKMEVIDIKK